jgi:hypothetical protein
MTFKCCANCKYGRDDSLRSPQLDKTNRCSYYKYAIWHHPTFKCDKWSPRDESITILKAAS